MTQVQLVLLTQLKEPTQAHADSHVAKRCSCVQLVVGHNASQCNVAHDSAVTAASLWKKDAASSKAIVMPFEQQAKPKRMNTKPDLTG